MILKTVICVHESKYFKLNARYTLYDCVILDGEYIVIEPISNKKLVMPRHHFTILDEYRDGRINSILI